jgi:protein TonB
LEAGLPQAKAKNRDVFKESQYRKAAIAALAAHLALAAFLLLPPRKTPPVRVLALMEFEIYDPLGGDPGGGGALPELEPEPAPALAPPLEPEPEPEEEPPQLVESSSDEAEEAPPPPPPPPPEKPKPKPRPKPTPARAPPAGPASASPSAEAGSAGTGAGTGQEGAGQGGAGGGTGRGNPDALAAYKARVQRRLERSKKYPPLARSNRIEGIVYVTFTVNKEGRVVSSSIARSSGHASLDDEAMGLLRRVNPLPSIPDEVRATAVTLTAPIQFRLR